MSTLPRRRFLLGALAAGTLPGCSAAAPPAAPSVLRGYPFTLGVASGDPAPDGVVLWTRLAPAPLEGGGMPAAPVAVGWEVGADERFARIVARGTAVARPDLAHSVHVEVGGLAPARWYWYRFRVGTEASPTGRTRTAPAPGAPVDRLRFAFASCQHWEHGYFTAYRDMVDGTPDLIVHLGDYIYEGAARPDQVRQHDGPEPTTLAGYRSRHALYKLDAALQAAHAACPWVVTWDDHDVVNDYAGDASPLGEEPAVFRERRAAAYQAYYEHMPLRTRSVPRAVDVALYRELGWGDLARFFVLDNRQYRSVHACGRGAGGRLVEDCAARLDPARTLLGAAQEQWLLDGLDRSAARWNVLAQQQLMAEIRQRNRRGAPAYWTDGWDGYPAARARLLAHIAARRPANPIAIAGDIHSFWVTDLRADFADPRAPVVATEFCGTSLTSVGIPYERFASYLPDNPHVRFFESRQRGYVRCTVDRGRWRSELRVVKDVRDERSASATLAAFVVESGRPGAERE
ncbi:MAG: alkaline phosphatase D family protein [Candidatus Rokubacteria bacterium]|nr:alkaline phosphatase D family protein [Candidatus Rokubacteria bacterium]